MKTQWNRWTRCSMTLLALVACSRSDIELRYRAERELWRYDRKLNELHESSPRSVRGELLVLAASYEQLASHLLAADRSTQLRPRVEADVRNLAAEAWTRSAETFGAAADSTAVERILADMAREFAEDSIISSQVALERGRIAETQGDWQAAGEQYEFAATTQSDPELRSEARLRSAGLAQAHGDWPQAVAILESLAADLNEAGSASPCCVEVDLRLLEVRIGAGVELAQILVSAREIQSKYARSDLGTRALLLGAEASALRGDDRLASTLVDEVLGQSKDIEDLARAMRLRAQILERANDWPHALATLRELQIRYPVSAAALHANLDQVDHFERLGDPAAVELALDRAERSLRDFLASYPTGSQTDLAQRLLLETLDRQGRAEDAVRALLEFAEHCAGPPQELVLLSAAAERSATIAAGRERALALFDRIAADYPSTRLGARAAQQARRLRESAP